MNRVGLWSVRKQVIIVAVDDKRGSVTNLQSGTQRVEYRGAPHPKTAYSAQ